MTFTQVKESKLENWSEAARNAYKERQKIYAESAKYFKLEPFTATVIIADPEEIQMYNHKTKKGELKPKWLVKVLDVNANQEKLWDMWEWEIRQMDANLINAYFQMPVYTVMDKQGRLQYKIPNLSKGEQIPDLKKLKEQYEQQQQSSLSFRDKTTTTMVEGMRGG